MAAIEVEVQAENRTAVLLGASGLVGRTCLRRLVDHALYSKVVVVTRRDLGPQVEIEKVTQLIVDFDRLPEFSEALSGDDAFCAFGTTIKKAGSRERFRQIDADYPAEFARILRSNGARHFSLVSSRGANSRSRFLYLRVKGELEETIARQEWPSLAVLRPSVIGGRRHESRPSEHLGQLLLRGAPASIRTVPASAIASTMIRLAKDRTPGTQFVESRQMRPYD